MIKSKQQMEQERSAFIGTAEYAFRDVANELDKHRDALASHGITIKMGTDHRSVALVSGPYSLAELVIHPHKNQILLNDYIRADDGRFEQMPFQEAQSAKTKFINDFEDYVGKFLEKKPELSALGLI